MRIALADYLDDGRPVPFISGGATSCLESREGIRGNRAPLYNDRAMKKRGGKKSTMKNDEHATTLDDVRGALSAARRTALDAELERIKRRFAYAGGKRGPKAKYGEPATDRVVAKMPTRLRREIEGAARGIGLTTAGDYLVELHRRHVAAGGKVIQ